MGLKHEPASEAGDGGGWTDAGSGVKMQSLANGAGVSAYPLHPTPYTPHPTPYTLHPTPYILHPTPYTLHPTPYTTHPTPYALYPTPYTRG